MPVISESILTRPIYRVLYNTIACSSAVMWTSRATGIGNPQAVGKFWGSVDIKIDQVHRMARHHTMLTARREGFWSLTCLTIRDSIPMPPLDSINNTVRFGLGNEKKKVNSTTRCIQTTSESEKNVGLWLDVDVLCHNVWWVSESGLKAIHMICFASPGWGHYFHCVRVRHHWVFNTGNNSSV